MTDSRMSKSLATLLLAAAVLLGPSAHAAETKLLDGIIAVVNNDVILRSDLRASEADLQRQARDRGQDLPPSDVLQKQLLERLILEQVQLQQARDRGISVDERSLDRTLQNIATQNNMDLISFRSALLEQGYNWQRFRETIRREMIIARARKRLVTDRINVSDQEIDDFLANRARDQAQRIEYRLQHILIGVPQGSDAAVITERREQAESLLETLEAGTDFALTASIHSDGEKALEGGDLGWRTLDKLPTLFADALAGKQVGDIAGPLRSPNGFHILRLADSRGEEKHITRQSRSRHILLKPNAVRDDETTRAELQALRDRIAAGEDFAELAREHSEDTASAVDGGELPWYAAGMMVPAFERVSNSLQPGEMSQPFRSQFGWHVMELLGRRNLDETREVQLQQARQAIRERKSAEETELWLRRLRDEAYVELRDEA